MPTNLVILSDVPGVLRDANDPESIISSLTRSEAVELIENGTISARHDSQSAGLPGDD